MPAIINPDDASKPSDSDAVNYPASMGAGELRALKGKINSIFLNTGVAADGEFLTTTNNMAIYAKVTANPSSNATILYGFASNVTRTGKDNHVVGGQFSGILGPGLTLASGQIFGVVSQAISSPTSIAPMVAAEFAVCNFYPNVAAQALIGCNLVFKDRMDTEVTPVAGLSTNRYNVNSIGLWFTSQSRGTAGEYCGWNSGIVFDEFSMDIAAGVRGHAMDVSKLHYDGGSDPTTAYRVSSILRMRALQSIILDDSGASTVRFFFDPFAARIKFTVGGVERWGLDVATGQVYKNGILQY